MFKHLETFLKEHLVPGKPVLFGYSGGVDSSCLFHLLNMYKNHMGLDLHIIHIHHGWRPGSLEEAYILKKQVELLNIPFYLETITGIDPTKEGNLEEKYRNERINIFKRYYQDIGAQSLLLAHQKEDQAETIFKRIFEGASLIKLIGLKECSSLEGMKILRPLLRFSKKQLYEFARKEEFPFIEDETNKNPKYLRARQRVSIFPEIERSFGKNCLNNLCKLGDNVHKYEKYMEKKLQRYEELIVKGPFGSYINLSSLCPLEPLELELFIRKVCESYKQSISFDALEMLVDKVLKKASNKNLKLQDIDIFIDRDHIFFVHPIKAWPTCEEISIDKLPYTREVQGYLWTITEVASSVKPYSWKDFWMGEVDFMGPTDSLKLAPVDFSYRVGGKSLKDLYIENKVPAFLRDKVPSVFQGGLLRCNPLISLSLKDEKDKRKFRISIQFTGKIQEL